MGHHLVVLLARARLWSRTDGPREAHETEWLERTCEAALTDLRRALALLDGSGSDNAEPSAEDILDWLAELPGSLPAQVLDVDVTVRDSGPGLSRRPPGVRSVLDRVVREGVSNGVKHRPGGRMSVELDVDDEITATFHTRGAPAAPPPAPPAPGAGRRLGLRGIASAVAEHDGELWLDASDPENHVMRVTLGTRC